MEKTIVNFILKKIDQGFPYNELYDEFYRGYIKKEINDIKKNYNHLIGTIKESWNLIMNDKWSSASESPDTVQSFRKKWESIIEKVENSDKNIKNKTNTILFEIHTYTFESNTPNNALLFENMGFSKSDGYPEDIPDNCEVPRNLQIYIFELIQEYSSLMILSMELMALFGKISSFLIHDYPNESMEINNNVIVILQSLSKDVNEMKDEIKELHQIEKKTESGVKQLVREEKNNTLTQNQCASIYLSTVKDYIDKRNEIIRKNKLKINILNYPQEESILRKIQRWDSNKKNGSGYYPKDYNRHMTPKRFYNWAKEREDNKYAVWLFLYNNKPAKSEEDYSEDEDDGKSL